MNTTLTSIKQIYKGGHEDKIQLDLHVWVECNGVEIDYDDDDLKKCSLYGTDKIVRVPFPSRLSYECFTMITEVVDAKMKIAKQNGVVDDCIEYWLGTTGNCCCRALFVYKSLTDLGYKPKIKIGSLGFIQSNNKDIFYEYG